MILRRSPPIEFARFVDGQARGSACRLAEHLIACLTAMVSNNLLGRIMLPTVIHHGEQSTVINNIHAMLSSSRHLEGEVSTSGVVLVVTSSP